MGRRQRILSRIGETVVRYPGWVLVAACLLVLAARHVGRGLEIRGSRLDFLPPGDPAVIKYRWFTEQFGSAQSVLLIVEGPVEAARAFVDEAGVALGGLDRWIRSVTWKLDRQRFEAQGFYLQEVPRLEEIYGDLMESRWLIQSMARAPRVGQFLTDVTEEMSDPEASAPSSEKASKNLEFILNVVRGIDDVLLRSKSEDVVLFPTLGIQDGFKRLRVDDRGHLASADGRYRLIVLAPRVHLKEDEIIAAFLQDLEARLEPIRRRYPAVRVGRAGSPIRNSEEEAIVKADLKTTSAVAGIGIFLLSLIAFGGLVPAVLILAVLVLVVVLTMAATALCIGHLNLISVVFVAILFGLGHDFGSYLIILAREWLPTRGIRAYHDAIVTAGSSLLTAALTTAAAFFSLTLHDLVAFRELGIIAGSGVLIAYAAMLTVLPAGLCLLERIRRRWRPAAGGRGPGRVPGLTRILVRILPRVRLVAAILVLPVLAAVPFLDRNRFEYDLQNLMPDEGESARNEKILRAEFGISSDFNVIVTESLEETYRVFDRLKDAATVARIDSLAQFVPRDVEAKAGIIERIRTRWVPMVPPVARDAAPTSRTELERDLAQLRQALEHPLRLARMDESAELEAWVKRLDGQIGVVLSGLVALGAPEYEARIRLLDGKLADEIEDFRMLIGNAATGEPYSLESLPEELKARFIGSHGLQATYVTPSVDVSFEENARAFYEETREADPGATGLPVIVYRVMDSIKAGWLRAAGWAMLGIGLMILLDFKSLGYGALALLPLTCGMVSMIGVLHVLGIPWNALSSVAMPILVGVGIDYGVNLLHRYLEEGDMEVALGSTGRAIFYAAATSCVGFGSLTVAHHRGLASFGTAMFLGVLFSMLAALLILPAVVPRIEPGAGPDDPGPARL